MVAPCQPRRAAACMCLALAIAWICLADVSCVRGSVLSVAKLESCLHRAGTAAPASASASSGSGSGSGGGSGSGSGSSAGQASGSGSASSTPRSLSCDMKFVVALTVANGQNATESTEAYLLDSAVDAKGAEYQLQETIRITLAKSRIGVRYTPTYVREFNNRPSEVMQVTSDTALDACTARATCGHVAGAPTATDSGFCCRCDFVSLYDDGARGNLMCDVLDAGTQAAHCLRMDPLWYSAFSLGPPQVEYFVHVHIARCRRKTTAPASAAGSTAGGAEEEDEECEEQVQVLTPSSPGVCARFPPRADEAAGSSQPDGSQPGCTVLAELEGDFAAFTDAPDLGGKYLMIPHTCDDRHLCGSRVTDPPERWMLVDKRLTTHASGGVATECNKIGVSYDAFVSQASRCQAPWGSCLGNQLEHLYQADLAAERAGRKGDFFVKFNLLDQGQAQGQGQGTGFNARVTASGQASAVFDTPRLQRSVIRLELAADAVRFTVNTSPGSIRSARVLGGGFEAQSDEGVLQVRLLNIGDLRAQFTVEVVECTPGVAPVQAREVTLEAAPRDGSEVQLNFALHVETAAAAAHACTVNARDAQYAVTDTVRVEFRATVREDDRATQGGSVVGRDVEDEGPGEPPQRDIGDRLSCPAVCPSMMDVACALAFNCFTRLLVLVGAAAASCCCCACCLQHPRACCWPLRRLAHCLKCRWWRDERHGEGKEGKRGHHRHRHGRHHRGHHKFDDAAGP